MNLVELLAQLREQGIQLWAEDGRLRYRTAEGALPAELREQLTSRKAEILAFLQQVASAEHASTPRIQPVDRAQPLPLSFAQERLWFIDQWEPGRATYNLPRVVRLRGRLDIDALRAGLSAVVRRHEVLRTTFAAHGSDLTQQGRAVQIIHPPSIVALPCHDLRALPEPERTTTAQRLVAEEADRPFDLQHGPLLRVLLLRTDDNEHLLVLNMHHIISDGWSSGLLINELTTLYSAAVEGKSASCQLPALPIQYADYAVWQRSWLQGDVLERQLDYWKTHLADAPTLLELPTDRPRPARQSFKGTMVGALLPKALIARLEAVSQRADATLFMTLLAAFQTLLYRYTGQEDLVVGSPVSGRSRVEIEPLIGCFVNMLPLRIDMRGNPTFRELLGRVRAMTLQAYQHQEVPFEKIVEAVQPARTLSHAPIFQVVFMLEYAATGSFQLPDLELSPVDTEHTVAKFDLELALSEGPDGIWAGVEYSTDLFDAATITRLLGHYQTLLEQIAADPQQRIGLLPLLTSAEHEQIRSWQGQSASYPVGGSLHTRFEQIATQTPDAIVAVFEEQRLSYADLNARANQLAHELRSRGVRAETPVALYLNRSLDLVVAVLAILKAGGAYVPLDPAYPAERVAMILSDAETPVVLTHAALRDALPPHGAQTICLDRNWPQIDRQPTSNLDLPVDAAQLAYIIYTSGSTGRPKGVLVSHAHVLRLFAATDDWFHFDEQDVWTLFHSIAFDFSVWELWGALLYGGRLVVVSYLTSRAPDLFYDLLRQERVTVLNQTPSAFRQLIQAEASLDGQSADLALRSVIFGGEALDLPGLRPWFARHGDQQPQLVNMYGITETTVHVTYRPLRSDDVADAAPSVVGGPIPDLQIYLLDRYGQPVPVGVAGEIYVGGAGVARGYLNRPDLTAERFVPDPFSGNPGARLYRAGDLARYLPNGDLHYLGRIDHQVKIRGFRIELGEIEAAIQRHPAVREVLVLARQDGPGDARLVAYVVGEQRTKEQSTETIPSPTATEGEADRGLGQEDWGDEGQPRDLRAFLKTYLPDYMIPSAFVWLDAFPLTPNGKLDRRALPKPDQSRPELATTLVAPRTPAEEALAAAWSEVLGIERIGVHDNFFGLGGDSIRSLQVVAAARARGIGITIQQMFEHQTIADLAEMIGPDELLSSPPLAAFDRLSAADREKLPADIELAYPLATMQSGMLFHSAASPEAALYQDCFSFHLRAPYDPAALRSALDTLSTRHAVLRTSFDLSRFEQPLQLVHRRVEVPLLIDDLRALDGEAQAAALAEWMAVEQRTPFDWTRPPLLRIALHRRTDSTFQITISCHHALLDGWSVALLIGELFQLYRAGLSRETQPLPTPGQSFADFVALEQQALDDPVQLDYWRNRLDGSKLTMVPRWGPPQPEEAQAASRADLEIPAEVMAGLQRLAQTTNVPFKSVLLAAHLRVVSLLAGQSDIVTGLVVNGRPETEHSDRTMGMFLNTIPLRFNLTGGTWIDLIRATFAAEREALPYRRYPLARLQQQLGGQTLFETAFNFVHFHVLGALEAEDDIEGLGGSAIARNNFPLAAHFSQDPGTGDLGLSLDYDPTLLRPAQVAAYCGYYARALAAMVREPLARYETLDLLTEAERRQLLVEWNATATAVQEGCAHELFAAQAAQTPDAPAVVFVNGDVTEHLSYAELDQRADGLARELQARGVRPETVVGLYLDRSPELIVAILGVLKAGGAYVPLDPTYPVERLRFMLADADVSLVLTRQQFTRQLAELAPAQAQVLCLDSDWSPSEAAAIASSPARIQPEQLAYMIYTSGSTGQPKGVLVSHRGIGNLAQAQIAAFDVRPDSRVLQFAALSFDAAVSEIWMALLSGAALYLAPREALLPGPDLLDLMVRHAIDVVTLPPSALAALPSAELPALRTIAVAGEACPPEVLARWERPGRRLINAYGPTEATVCATMAVAIDSSQRPPIGRPIANGQVFVLDDRLEPVAVGVPGEVFIGGVGLARGYHHRPDLTAERFVPHPFSGNPGARLYRTGDLARWLPDGSLDYLRRRDDQVKLRGFRIELGEIESVLRQHEAVRDVVVIVRDDGHDAQRLVAYVVENKGTKEQENKAQADTATPPSPIAMGEGGRGDEGLASTLHTFLGQRLPAYMVPSAFVVLDTLPVTPSGKLDRKALPEPEQSQPDANMIAPRDRWELDVARLWQELLHSGPVSVDDDFFKRGGDSLLAVRLVARIEQELGRRIQVASLISAPTVEQIAALIRQQPADQEWSPLVPIQTHGSRPPLFCVHPIGGHVLCYVQLAQEIGRDQPCYGLQARGLERDEPPPMSIEAMAADYITAIRAVQPHGPYLLSGWSFGGVVAFEMAQQLLRQGEEVALLALLDSSLDPPIKAGLTSTEEILNLAWGLSGIFGKEVTITAEELEGRDQEEQLAYLLDRIQKLELLPADIGLPQMRRYLAVFRTSVMAAHSYVPQVYPQSIMLLLAEDMPPALQESRVEDWGNVAGGGLGIATVPGNHYSMMRTPEQMARQIRSALDQAIERAGYATESHTTTQLPV